MKYYCVCKSAPNFSLQQWKGSETKEAEEYCWAMTQVAGQLRCGRSRAGVLESGIKSDLPLCIHTRFATCALNSDLHKSQSVSRRTLHSATTASAEECRRCLPSAGHSTLMKQASKFQLTLSQTTVTGHKAAYDSCVQTNSRLLRCCWCASWPRRWN